SVVVQPSGVTTFQTSLARGGAYLLKASGTLNVGGTAVDAEFAGFDATGNGAMDIVAGIDVGVDVGLLEVHPMNHYTVVPSGPGRMKWYGSHRADHTYYMWITGAGAPLTLKLAAPAGSPGQGASGISVSIFELAAPSPATFQPMPGPMPPSPAAPKIGKGALETVYVPVTKTIVHGTVTTDKAAVYLLQASGAAICGGGGLSMGDADYMDWTAAGAGFNDGEAGVDFGLGVDELNVGQGAGVIGGGYGHRLKGWGPFRNDHIYFMLYAGTGNPLSFVYWDSGYGDNSTTQALAVNVFPLP
ncbi:MAG: hypothetical protein M3O46_07800, partial [Myxococcota bacterium]|nr:hypothetical protein [Myxococcota bacterium]